MTVKVLISIASTRPSHGGTSRSAPYLANALARVGAEVHIVTANPPGAGQPEYLSDRVGFHNMTESGWFQGTFRSPLRWRGHLEEAVGNVQPDVIHDQGVWLPSNRAAFLVSSAHGIPLVVTPRGHLTKWSMSHKPFRKRLAWILYQRRIVNRASLVHVTSEQEKKDLEDLGIAGPFATVPNGVEIPAGERIARGNGAWPRKALFLSRIDPKKGLPLLLKAWEAADTGEWSLELVGPGESEYVCYISSLVEKMDDPSVRISGPVVEEDKWDAYRSAGLFVLPSHSENFGIVVAEALAAGLPVITTTATPWGDLQSRDCGWWVEPRLEALVPALEQALSSPGERLREMGERGQALVREKYDWDRIAERMLAEYSKLISS